MKDTIIALTVLALVALQPSIAAAESSKQEAVGVGSGALVGAAAGGPVGFLLGAAVGGYIGDAFERKSERNERLNADLAMAGERVAALEAEVDAMDNELEALGEELVAYRRDGYTDGLALLEAGIEADLLFRTAESTLPENLRSRVERLARTLAGVPAVAVRLDGYADGRGAEEYNERLSLARAAYVRDLLVDAGVDPRRIHTEAHGEQIAEGNGADSLALARRVSLTLTLAGPVEEPTRVADKD